VRHEQSGLLVRPGDVEELRCALERVIANPSLRMSFGEEGRQLWAENFTARAMAARTVGVYEKALACA
jgi:glycosyltransferase involved in cell wall biosynthesis